MTGQGAFASSCTSQAAFRASLRRSTCPKPSTPVRQLGSRGDRFDVGRQYDALVLHHAQNVVRRRCSSARDVRSVLSWSRGVVQAPPLGRRRRWPRGCPSEIDGQERRERGEGPGSARGDRSNRESAARSEQLKRWCGGRAWRRRGAPSTAARRGSEQSRIAA